MNIYKYLMLNMILFCEILSAQPFGCNDLIRRFGPNSYVTCIPLFFDAIDKQNTKVNSHKKHKTINKKSKTTQLSMENFFGPSKNEQLNLFIFTRLFTAWSDRNGANISGFFEA